MELERAEMIAEVEAQIETALASMATDMDESECGSRPASRMSSRSAPNMRRSGSRSRPLRSFSTDSTLAESYSHGALREEGLSKHSHRTSTVPEMDEPEDSDATNKKKKRFSTSRGDQDIMTAVDEGINLKTDKIAQKVIQIQRKVRLLDFDHFVLLTLPNSLRTRWRLMLRAEALSIVAEATASSQRPHAAIVATAAELQAGPPSTGG